MAQVSPSSRSILMNPPTRIKSHSRRAPRIETVMSACYELDDDEMPTQITFRVIESLKTARSRLGPQVIGMYLRWRLDHGVLIVVLGLGNLNTSVPTSCDGLRYRDDGQPMQSEWYREGRYPSVDRNTLRCSIIRHHWGPERIADITRVMCNTF